VKRCGSKAEKVASCWGLGPGTPSSRMMQMFRSPTALEWFGPEFQTCLSSMEHYSVDSQTVAAR